MATRQILAALCKRFEEKTGANVSIESMGGVDAARAVREGRATDVVILASDVMHKLESEGFIVAGSVTGVARSRMGIAVRAGTSHPDISSAKAVRRAIEAARRVGYSTGPSGDHLLKLCDTWGLAGGDRLIKAPPGVPVASLVAQGTADLGFQQLSELMNVPDVEIVGPLPTEIEAVTVFAAGVSVASPQASMARTFIDYLTSPDGDDVKRAHGMEPC